MKMYAITFVNITLKHFMPFAAALGIKCFNVVCMAIPLVCTLINQNYTTYRSSAYSFFYATNKRLISPSCLLKTQRHGCRRR